MKKIRVMVVDDSVVVRRLVTDSLSADPRIDVVGVAPNGKVALAKIDQLNPDLITLDIEMPVMDGLETLLHLRQLHPKLPVIMFSTLTERGAATTLDALERGARDYVTKPANVGSVVESMAAVRAQIVPKIMALCAPPPAPVIPVRRPLAPAGAGATAGRPLDRTSTPVDVLAIGVSTGGPDALSTVLAGLPADLPVPVVIVQHMPPVFTAQLAQRLDKRCPLTVTEAKAGDVVVPGRVLLAPGDFHMRVRRVGAGVGIVLDQGTPENYCRPAVDVLFRSVVEVYGGRTLAVVLTGMGADGARASADVVAAGGEVYVQDEATSVVWGMPGAVARAGLADQQIPLGDVAAAITTRVRAGRGGAVPARALA